MAYIFLDESGDLGFDWSKKKTSKYFVVTFLFIESKRPLSLLVKKMFKGFTKKELKHHPGILHAYKEKPKTRIKMLTHLNQHDVSVLAICLNKKKVYTQLRDEKHVLYNYISNILLDRIITKKLIPIDKPIQLIAARRETNKFLNENFKEYLKQRVQESHKLDLSVHIKTLHEEKGLQVVDLASWSIYRKLEHDDASYTALFESKIVEQSFLFP
jgi:hypothetical protein